MHCTLFPHIQLDYSQISMHDVTDRASGSSCCTIHVGLHMGRILGLPGCSHCGDDPPPRILHTSYIGMPYVQSPDTCNIASVVDGVQRHW